MSDNPRLKALKEKLDYSLKLRGHDLELTDQINLFMDAAFLAGSMSEKEKTMGVIETLQNE